MLRRAVTVLIGGILLGIGAYVAFLHRTSEEPLRSILLLAGTALLFTGIVAVMDGLFRRR